MPLGWIRRLLWSKSLSLALHPLEEEGDEKDSKGKEESQAEAQGGEDATECLKQVSLEAFSQMNTPNPYLQETINLPGDVIYSVKVFRLKMAVAWQEGYNAALKGVVGGLPKKGERDGASS